MCHQLARFILIYLIFPEVLHYLLMASTQITGSHSNESQATRGSLERLSHSHGQPASARLPCRSAQTRVQVVATEPLVLPSFNSSCLFLFYPFHNHCSSTIVSKLYFLLYSSRATNAVQVPRLSSCHHLASPMTLSVNRSSILQFLSTRSAHILTCRKLNYNLAHMQP